MNGLNKQKNNFKKKTALILLVYLIVSLSVVFILNNLSIINDSFKSKEVSSIKKQIEVAISNNENKRDDLGLISKEVPMELVVLQENNVIFSNTAITDIEILRENVNDDVVFYNSTYKISNDSNEEFQVWLMVYDKTASEMFNIIAIVFVSAFLIVSVILTVLVYTSSRLLIKPLDYLGSNLKKLKAYKFDGVMSIDDKVELFATELKEFAQDIKSKSEDFGVAYTSLEKELLIKDEESNYKKQLVSSLVHDLKTPLSIIKLHAKSLGEEIEYQDNLQEQQLALIDINENADAVLGDVREILNVVNLEKIESGIEPFDLTLQVKQSIKLFSKLLKDRELIVNLELLPKAIVEVNKIEIQSVINNALANIYKYAATQSEVDISLSEDDSKYTLAFINEASEIESIDFDNAFSLFQVNDSSQNGTGVGLFVVNKFVQKNNGNCRFENFEDKVILQIELPKNGGVQDEA